MQRGEDPLSNRLSTFEGSICANRREERQIGCENVLLSREVVLIHDRVSQDARGVHNLSLRIVFRVSAQQTYT